MELLPQFYILFEWADEVPFKLAEEDKRIIIHIARSFLSFSLRLIISYRHPNYLFMKQIGVVNSRTCRYLFQLDTPHTLLEF